MKGLKKTGEYFDVEVSLTVPQDEIGESTGLFCACRDISERKRTQQEADFLAFHDALTGLPNRLLFKERLEQTLVRVRQRDSIIALLFIDLDHFKQVNDTLGHSVGDQLLRCVAKKIQSVFRNEDMVARLSGDEFTVLLSELNNRHDIDTVINKLMQAFRKPMVMDNRELFQSISVGVSVYPQDGQDAETLMKNADAAMYRVKDDGRQNYCFYTPELTHSAQENLLYRGQLQYALENREFELHYQPLISLTDNKIVGFEALIRWRHPELGLVPPDKFIGHAEESHLIIPIGIWVIETVCQQIIEWQTNGVVFEKIAVNVSGIQLRPGFANTVADILCETQFAPRFLELEITETFLMQGLKQPVNQLQELRKLGIKLAIDDFGVGYSSLSQLKQLPTQCLKIDRSFVGDIVDDLDDRAIVEAVIGLGQILNLAVTAEGVETSEQHSLLKKMGCQKAQGYFYAKPSPAAEIPDLYQSLSERLKH